MTAVQRAYATFWNPTGVDDFLAQVSGISALAEPARRELYRYVVAQPEPVSRDQAAAGTGLPRHTVKFHLDKLVEEGLLVTEFRRLSGRRGPGAGRPTKLYRRSDRQVTLTLPERHYELAAQILAGAVSDAARDGTPVLEAVQHGAGSPGGVGAVWSPGEHLVIDGVLGAFEGLAGALQAVPG